MKYDQDELYLIIDFLEEELEKAKWEEDAVMLQATLAVIKTLIKE